MGKHIGLVVAFVSVLALAPALASASWSEDFNTGNFPDIGSGQGAGYVGGADFILAGGSAEAMNEPAPVTYNGASYEALQLVTWSSNWVGPAANNGNTAPTGKFAAVHNSIDGAGTYAFKLLNCGNWAGIVFGFVDVNNTYLLELDGTWGMPATDNIQLAKLVGGTKTNLGGAGNGTAKVNQLAFYEGTITWNPAAGRIDVSVTAKDASGNNVGTEPMTFTVTDSTYTSGKFGFGSGYWANNTNTYNADYLSFTEVPEPMTLALLALGGLGMLRRRNR